MRSRHQFLAATARLRERGVAEESEVLPMSSGSVDVAVEIGLHARRALPVDAVHVEGEVIGLRVVEAVALVRVRTEGHVDESVHGESRNDRAVGMKPDLLLG